MALNAFQVASLEGPGSKKPKPKPTPGPGLTGADLERAKAEAELASADKGYDTATAQHAWTRMSPLAAAGADAAENLNNITTGRYPETAKIIDALVDHLRSLTSPRP